MPDFKHLVRRRLPVEDLVGPRQERIVEEIASQLEDLYQEALESGASAESAEVQALDRFDWELLHAGLAQAEEPNRQGLLTPRQRRLAGALAERILPRTDTPGALDAGVDLYIDAIVSDFFSAEDRQS